MIHHNVILSKNLTVIHFNLNFCLLKDILEISQSLHGLICLFLQVKRAKLNHQLSSMYRETNMKLHFFLLLF